MCIDDENQVLIEEEDLAHKNYSRFKKMGQGTEKTDEEWG